MHRHFLLASLTLPLALLVACATTPRSAPPAPVPSQDRVTSALRAPLGPKNVHYLHLAQTALREGDVLKLGDAIGTVAPWPEQLSANNNAALKQAITDYDRGDYQAALDLLRPLYDAEVDNPFYLIYTAKTLYWFEGGADLSLSLLQRLNSMIESPFAGDTNVVVLDLWFPDLYWKLATLYLDKGKYDAAAYELARSFALGLKEPDAVREQMLSYFTEAYYQLGEVELNHILYDYTLTQFPNNEYIKKYHLP